MAGKDTTDTEAPPGWTVEEVSDDVHSWLGAEEQVICARVADGEDVWTAYAQPRSELAVPAQIPLFDAPAPREEALSAAMEYMTQNDDAE